MALPSDQYDTMTGLDHVSQHVEFYVKKDSVPPNKVYCRIITPGDKTLTHDDPATDYDKARFGRHWMAFQMQENEQASSGFGTPLEQWVIDQPGVINDNQRAELFHLGFRTVEQVAMATDGQIQRMPLGGVGMREQARTYLKNKASGDADGEREAMRAQIASLVAMVEKLSDPTAIKIRKVMAETVPIDPTIPIQPRIPRKTRGPNKIKRQVRTPHGEQHAAATGGASHG